MAATSSGGTTRLLLTQRYCLNVAHPRDGCLGPGGGKAIGRRHEAIVARCAPSCVFLLKKEAGLLLPIAFPMSGFWED
jgi:hypothetical protein